MEILENSMIKFSTNEGNKIACIMIPGTGCLNVMFRGLSEEISKRADVDVYAVNLPRHGGNTLGERSFRGYIDYLIDVVNDLRGAGYDKVFVAGHSLGGALALYMGTVFHCKIDGIISMAGSAEFRSNMSAEAISEIQNGNIPTTVREGVVLDVPILNEYNQMQLCDKETFIDDFKIDISINFKDRLRMIKLPVRYLVGENDEFVNTKMVRQIKGRARYVHSTVYPGFSHSSFMEHKKDFGRIITNFIESVVNS